jgi:uncharacterized protein YegJ (DUF2314 family)
MSTSDPNEPEVNPYGEKPEGEPLFMALRDSDIAGTIQEAQRSLATFRRAIETSTCPNAIPSVKSFIRESVGLDGIHLWLGVKQLDEDGFVCYPFEIPAGFEGLNLGEYVYVPNETVEDWMLHDQGTTYGAYSLRLQRSKTPERLRSEFDRYTGITCFAETLP